MSKLATKSGITNKIDFDSPKPGELTETEKAEATAKILKLFDDYISGVTTETSKVGQERSTMTVDRVKEDVPTNLLSKPDSGGIQQKSHPSAIKTQSNAPFKNSVSQKEENLYKTLSKKRTRIPPREQFPIDDELSSWPHQSEIHRSRRRPTYLKNDMAAEYGIFAPKNQFSRGQRGSRRHSGLLRASDSYWNNLRGTMWDRDSEYHRHDIYRLPNRYHGDFSRNYRDSYLRLPYTFPRPPQEGSIGHDMINAISYDNAMKADEAGRPKFDFVEDSQMEPTEKKFEGIVEDITSFTILNKMAINLLASENTSYSTENTVNTRNSSEFKYPMTILEGNLEFLEAELKEVLKRSYDEKLEFFRSVPHVLAQLTDLTRQAKDALRDSVDPSELIKNQQLEGIFVMMDDVIADIRKAFEEVDKKNREDAFRRERLMPLDEYADYANEISFLRRELAQCMRLCSRCS